MNMKKIVNNVMGVRVFILRWVIIIRSPGLAPGLFGD